MRRISVTIKDTKEEPELSRSTINAAICELSKALNATVHVTYETARYKGGK